MAKGMPSLVALLGLLAVAGYQNRDKLSEMLNGAGNNGTGGNAGGGLGGMLSGLGGLFGGSTPGGAVSGGLGDLLDRFKQNGQGDVADSWVSNTANRTLAPDDVATAIGEDNLTELSARTGLSRDELLKRLATNIPEGVNHFTPNGHLPTEAEAQQLLPGATS